MHLAPRAHAVIHTVDRASVSHRLELWRDGIGHVRRVTDARLSIHAEKRADEVLLTVVDLERRVRVIADRTQLARLGTLTDWSSFESGLTVPHGATSSARAAVAGCRWYRVSAATELCWSAKWQLAMRIVSDGQPVWTVERIDALTSATDLALPPGPMIEIDASADLAAD